jgi:hypothetical protein
MKFRQSEKLGLSTDQTETASQEYKAMPKTIDAPCPRHRELCFTCVNRAMPGILRANMRTSMILRRSKILTHIAAGKSNNWIARNCGHGRVLIRQMRAAFEEDPSQISILRHAIGNPPKLLPDVMERINDLRATNLEMSSAALAQIIGATPRMYLLSHLENIGYGADQRLG